MVREWLRSRSTAGFRRALAQVHLEGRLMARHFAGVRAARRQATGGSLKLHLGCGSNPKAGWINVDLWNRAADVSLDLREKWPFPDESAAIVYSEHLLEHFEYPRDVRHIMAEALRVLRPGGQFSVGVPDHGLALQAYARGDLAFFDVRRLRSYLLEENPTLMHHVNYSMRQDGLHKYSYDEETLVQVLRDNGFVGACRRDFDPALDSEKRRLMRTLYIDAHKPGTPAIA